MRSLRRPILWATLVLLILFLLLAVVGAFLGAERGARFFNSPPAAAFWVVLTAVIALGFAAFASFRRRFKPLILHVGAICVFAGSLWGSQAGHRLQEKWLGRKKVAKGYMIIHEGQAENRIFADDLRTPLLELPFSLRLDDFRITYYQMGDAPRLAAKLPDGQVKMFPAAAGATLKLHDPEMTLTVSRAFRNFRIGTDEQGASAPTDAPGPATNPAVAVTVERPRHEPRTRYVFANFPGHGHDDDLLQLRYIGQQRGPVKDYYSDVAIRQGGQRLRVATIEVNHPLHYGGYHFYQHSYDSENERYTILSVSSDTGLATVFTGYWLICLGAVWPWLQAAAAHDRAQPEKEA